MERQPSVPADGQRYSIEILTTEQAVVMSLDRDTKTAIAAGSIGAAFGCTLVSMNIRHDFVTGPVSLMLLGAFVMVLSPTIALLWALSRKGRIQKSDIVCTIAMFVGMLGMSQSDSITRYWFADIFGLLLWGGFYSLIGLMIYRVLRSLRASEANSGA